MPSNIRLNLFNDLCQHSSFFTRTPTVDNECIQHISLPFWAYKRIKMKIDKICIKFNCVTFYVNISSSIDNSLNMYKTAFDAHADNQRLY